MVDFDSIDIDLVPRSLALLLGLYLFIMTVISLLRTVVMPRNLESTVNDLVRVLVVYPVRTIARMRGTYLGRDSVLAWTGPLIIVIQLITWLLLFFLAYGLWIYGIGGGGDLGAALRQSGSSLFTLGFAQSPDAEITIIDFFAAATGPIVIALLIGFLPTIYSSYLQREEGVAMLGIAAGDPAWGPELISRTYLSKQPETLENMFHDWRVWATETRLTNVTYPVLTRMRSASPYRSWVISLLAVLDAAALQLALTKTLPRNNAVAVLLHGAQAFEVIYVMTTNHVPWSRRIPFVGMLAKNANAKTRQIEAQPGFVAGEIAVETAATADSVTGLPAQSVDAMLAGEAQPITLTRAEFEQGVEVLRKSGYPIENDMDTAWQQFSIARARYEFTAYQLAWRFDVVPGPWSGPRPHGFPTIWPTLATSFLKDDDA
jgi:hypothetical protein